MEDPEGRSPGGFEMRVGALGGSDSRREQSVPECFD